MPDPFDGIGNVDPLRDMGRGGYRDPNTGRFLGRGEEGLRRYNAALEALERQTRPGSNPVKSIPRLPHIPPAVGTLIKGAGRVLGPLGFIASREGIIEMRGGRPIRTVYDDIGEFVGGIGDGDVRTGPDRFIRSTESTNRGNCPTMGSLAADGTRCGRRAASVRGPTRGYDPPRRRPKTCNCPTVGSIAADGSRCGRRAASVRGPTRGYDGM